MAKQKKSRAEEEMRYPNLVAFSKCMDENGDIHDESRFWTKAKLLKISMVQNGVG